MASADRWHLDAWDRAGGRAFATRRSRGASLAEYREDWGPTVYIGPPDFRPEQVGNTSIALSASRAANFVESVPPWANAETELGFPTAAAVAEFVRLAFVSDGRNRGGGGGGELPVTPSEPPHPPEGADAEEDDLGTYFHVTVLLRKKLAMDRNETALPISSLAHGFPRAVRAAGIESGALQLIRTHLDARVGGGFPATWPHALTSLHRALVELEIWQEWLERPDSDTRNVRNAEYLWESVKNVLDLPADRQLDRKRLLGVIAAAHQCVLPAARLSPTYLDYARYLLENGERANSFYTYTAFGMPHDSFDRFAPMFSWQLPGYLVRQEKTVTSVGSLLMAFIAAPHRVAGWPGATDIVLFAAAFLASRVEDRASRGWRERAAASWLARSIPTHVFAEEIQRHIWDRG